MNWLVPLMNIVGPNYSGVLLLLIQALCLYTGVYNSVVFAGLWCVYFVYTYTDYFGTWMVSAIGGIIDSIAARFQTAVINSATVVRDQLQETGGALSEGTTMSGLVTNFSKHKVGVTLCAKTAISATGPGQVIEETVKVASMLGLEHSVINAAMGRLSSLSADAITGVIGNAGVQENGFEDIEAFIPLVSTIAAFADQELTDFQLNGKLDKISKNIKNAEVIMSQFRKVAETAGVIKPKNFSLIEELTVMVTELREDYEWIVNLLATKGSEFMKPVIYDRVRKFKEKVKNARLRFKQIDIPSIRNNQIVTECNSVLNKCDEYLNQIEVIRMNTGTRVVPVGVTIKGESHIGKSHLVPILCEKIKARLSNHTEIVGDASMWSRWDANQREEFDSGYCGQEIVYMDDAFQDKTNKDHLMWYSYISNTCVGTIQGVAEQKGLPFRGVLCVTTCNNLPTTSVAVSHIQALHNRWPFCITASLKKGAKVPKVMDPTFSHLSFECNPMLDVVAGRNGEEKSLDEIATAVAERIIENHILHSDTVRSIQNIPVVENGDGDGIDVFLENLEKLPNVIELPEDIDEEDEEALWNAGVKSEAESDDIVRAVLTDDLQRLEHVTHGVDISPEEYLKMGDRALQALQTIVTQEGFHTIDNVGSWTKFLQRTEGDKTFGFDKKNYRDENGLYVFLNSLGAWKVSSDEQNIFAEEFAKQPALSVEGTYGDRYIWAPFLGKGRSLVLVSDDTRSIIIEKLLPFWRRNRTNQIIAKQLVLKIIHHPFGRSLFRHAAIIPVYQLFPPLNVLQSAQLISINGQHWGRIPFIWNLPNRSRLTNIGYSLLMAPAWPALAMSRVFDYLDKIVVRLTTGLRSIVLRCMEYLGLNVSEFWMEIADLSVRMINDTFCAILASILLYLIWKLFNVLFRKKPEVKEHTYGGNAQKSRSERKTKQEKAKRVRVRELRLHGDEAHLFCKTACGDEDLCVEHEDETWYKFGECNQRESVYDPSYLSYAVEKIEDLWDKGEAVKVDVVCLQNTHCSMRFTGIDDFSVERSKFLGVFKHTEVMSGREVPVFEIEMDINSKDKFEEFYKNILSKFLDKKVCDWRAEMQIRIMEETVMFKIKVACLTTNIQGTPGRFVLSNLKDLKVIAEDLKGIKEAPKVSFNEVLENGQDDAINLVSYLRKNHQVFMSRVPLPNLDIMDIFGRQTHGLGHKDYIIFNAHNYDVNDIVRFWRTENSDKRTYSACKVVFTDKVRDFGIAKIISKEELKDFLISKQVFVQTVRISSVKDSFRSLESKIANEEEWKDLAANQTCLAFLPSSNGVSKGRASYAQTRSYIINGEEQSREYLEVSSLGVTGDFARPGDCGGVIVSCNDRKLNKIIGFHAGAHGNKWVGAIFKKDDLRIVEQHGKDDAWNALIVNGEPTDLPRGPCVKFVGKYIGTTKPTNPNSISKWKSAPWVEQFEEQLQPAPLDPEDERIKVDLPVNMAGRKSLLLDKNSKMCEELPLMDEEILEICIDHIAQEMALKIGHIHPVVENLDTVIKIGLNGHSDNQHVKAIDDRKACGEPWNRLDNCNLKSDFLDNIAGYLTLKKNHAGTCLEKRVKLKLTEARKGNRMISLYVSKLKDELLKLLKIETGGTRVFASVPIDKIICDAALFGNFKEAYCRNFIDLNHAIGVNPHGLGWRLIKEHLDKHPNCFDLDFGNFDKRLSESLIRGAFDIIRRVIQNRAPDGWDEARRILANESINSYMIDFDTVYVTDRGNKSGEYLTTVVNCICNDILSYYAWISITGVKDLGVFRDNVSLITFGDDKCESVSDLYADKYNYFSVKEVMKKIGHEITPGNKDGIERNFCGLDQMQFLKRTFVERDNMVVAPLLRRSIESPFVWTQTPNSDWVVWKNLIEASLFEAQLHGEEYYYEFLNKIKQCDDDVLLSQVSSILCCNFEQISSKYAAIWHKSKVHLDE